MINTRNHGAFLKYEAYAWLILGASAECISFAGIFGQRKAQPSQWKEWIVRKCQVLRQESALHALRWEQCPAQPFLPQALAAAGVGSEHSAAAFLSSPSGTGNSHPPTQKAISKGNKNVKTSPIQPHRAYRKERGWGGGQCKGILFCRVGWIGRSVENVYKEVNKQTNK